MIPTEAHAKKLWEKYHLPEQKRIHVVWVSRVAVLLGERLLANIPLLRAAALLHDIDKAAPKHSGERHPDAGIRILREEGMDEVADVVLTHPLHAILDPSIRPHTLEQKLLFLADKMVKYDIVGVDQRFQLWRNEHLPENAKRILEDSYPKVKALEQEVFKSVGLSLRDVVKLA